MRRTGVRLLGLALGCLLLLTVKASATPCYDLCSPQRCESECANFGGCASADPTVRCAGRQAYCVNSCQDGIEVIMYCSDACYTSPGGGGGGSGSPIFATKKPVEPPPQ